MPLVEHAPAKINLGLHVLRKRPDGYHDVETVLHGLDWADTIAGQPVDTLSMTCSDPSLPTDDDNLYMQAPRRLIKTCEVSRGAAVRTSRSCSFRPP